ncbi:MAG: RcnB family protein [Novosphingobium sp.]
MKKLLCAMASIALLVSPAAMAKPDHQQGEKHGEKHGEHAGQRGGHHDGWQRPIGTHHYGQQQYRQRHAANRVYNVRTYRTYNYGYADPARYRNNGRHLGWAQDRGNAYRWSEGERMGYNDWYYAPRVSYRRYQLRRPPYGYEWRRYDDRYVLVAISTGLIMSVILNAGR